MSTKTIADKLLIKPDTTVWLSHPDRLALLGPLPDGACNTEQIDEATIALLFADDAASLRTLLAEQNEGLSKPGIVWVAYPKGNKTDLNRDSLWPLLTAYGLRPNGQVAVDDVWSALRFRALKPGEAPFTGGNA
jgi:hypothetical protein